MPVALSLTLRQLIVREANKGHSLVHISDTYHLSYTTVCRIYQRYQREGAPGLVPHFFNCGVKKLTDRQRLYRRTALWLKRLHPKWGAGFIKVLLERRYHKRWPCTRTLQRWFKQAGLVAKKTRFAYEQASWVTKPHDLWQVDAKEKLRLKSGRRCCYLTFVDQKSGSLLKAFVFPPLPHQ
jgi:transposase